MYTTDHNIKCKRSPVYRLWLLLFWLIFPAAGLKAQDCTLIGTSVSQGQNYILITIPRVPGYSPSATGYSTCDLMQMVQYVDGLGRPLQTIKIKGSPLLKDVIAPFVYDQLGRDDSVKYLPFTINSSSPGAYQPSAVAGTGGYTGSAQYQFYQQPGQGYVNTLDPFEKTDYEPSPLNRMVEQGAPGAPWQLSNSGVDSSGHTLKFVYSTNDQTAFSTTPIVGNPGSKKVALFMATVNSDQTRTLVRAGGTANYPTGQLYLTISKNENWTLSAGCLGTTEEYKDKMGQLILKRTYNQKGATIEMLSTYYVYDDMGNLAFVLPPLASPDATGNISQTMLNNLCYQYQYDERNRLVQKRLPGKGWEYSVYNSIDQVVAVQDSLQRHNNQWIYSKYDGLGRPLITGLWSAAAISRTTLQNTVNGLTTLWETPVTTGTGYTAAAWPTTGTTPLTINYYDFYTGNLPVPAAYKAPVVPTVHTRGLLTATRTAILNTPTNVLWTVNYYDDLGRNVQAYRQHYLGGTVDTSNYDVMSSTYDFTNMLTSATRKHFTAASTTVPKLTIFNKYIYDHMGRQREIWQQIQNSALTPDSMKMVSKLDYNELGQLMTKHLHSKDSVNFLQNVNYTYNERGWPLIDSAALFSQHLCYNNGPAPQYNGNITSQSWASLASNGSFAYQYDWLNRLTSGISADNKYAERNISYDQGGNIRTLSRMYNNTLIDSLTYNYLSGADQTNQLQSLVDNSNDAGSIGHKSGTALFSSYDGNGNLVNDPSKGTGGITFTYNLLNLPQTISGLNTNYTYDANGQKLRTVIGTAITDYISGIQYNGTAGSETITFVPTPEGRALPNGTTLYNYEYTLSDHLGNSRLIFDTGSGIARKEQQDNYLPFGMDISEETIPSPPNYYLYNGKEIQENSQLYDYGGRFYDPVIARWTTLDPLAEINRRLSPFNYGMNNPLRMSDPDGMLSSDKVITDADAAMTDQLADDDAKLKWDNELTQLDGLSKGTIFLDKEKETKSDTTAKSGSNNGNKSQSNSGRRPIYGKPVFNGALSASSLLGHYLNGTGSDYILSKEEFNNFIKAMEKAGRLDGIRNKGIPVPGVDGLYQVGINTYGTSYVNAVGVATLYYNKFGFVGYSDWWNFDPKPWGNRSTMGEALTRFGDTLPGMPFYVIYGITPPVNSIPRN